MGLALGGIAAPLPRNIYGVMGSTNTLTLTHGGYSDGTLLKIRAVYELVSGHGATMAIVVDDGSTHTYGLVTGAVGSIRFFNAELIISATAQTYTLFSSDTAGVNTADALTISNIVSINANVTAGDGVIRSLTVEVLDAP